jgi:hypothetical protein
VPFTLAVFLPIYSSIVVEPKVTVTFFSVPSQLTVLLIFELILLHTQEKSIQNASFTDIFERFLKN